MFDTLENICLKKMMLEYLRTGEECYRKVIDYVNEGCVGDLDLRRTSITSLPEGLTVGGYLDLSFTPITSLPEGLTVGGGLYLANTPITNLPEGLTVGGDLHLRNTPIASLPEGLKVGGGLNLRNTPISKKYTERQLKQMLPNVEGEIYV